MERPTFGPFNIDTDNSATHADGQYLYVDVPSKGLTVAIKLDDEGIVVDVYPLSVASQPAASMWATYHDIQDAAEEGRR